MLFVNTVELANGLVLDAELYQITLVPFVIIFATVAFAVEQKLWLAFPVGVGVFWIWTKTGTRLLSHPLMVCEA